MKTYEQNVLKDHLRVAIEGYIWPGGYPIFLLTEDGGVLCSACCRKEVRLILAAIKDLDRTGGWLPAGHDVNWEDPSLFCDHCGSKIEEEYPEE